MSLPPAQRALYLDWMRGIAILAMMEIHAFAAWIAPEHRHGPVWVAARAIGSQAATAFLFLVGVSLALGLRAARDERDLAAFRVKTLKRGVGLLLAAHLFRVQELLLSGGQWSDVLRVDILNAIALSLALLAVVGASGARGAVRAAAAALLVVALTPLVARLPQPATPLYDYLYDGRQLVFPAFPFAAYALSGFAVGYLWARDTRAVWLWTAAVGVGLVVGCVVVQAYPAHYLALGAEHRIDPRYFGGHLGILLCLGAACRGLQPFANPARFGPVRQLGRTSLLAYWIHVNLCYGPLAWEKGLDLLNRASIPRALAWLAALVVLVLCCSVVRTRTLAHVRLNELFWKAIGLPLPARSTPRTARA
ncbi:MAG: DUF1624 domain-containing protein [Deltaproteobacteria bacterium]|nr:DUF1624 domain-containing protein [Deltaproteobacteria bacterium]